MAVSGCGDTAVNSSLVGVSGCSPSRIDSGPDFGVVSPSPFKLTVLARFLERGRLVVKELIVKGVQFTCYDKFELFPFLVALPSIFTMHFSFQRHSWLAPTFSVRLDLQLLQTD